MNNYKSIFPDRKSESLLNAVLKAYYDQKKLTDSIAAIPAKIKEAIENKDPKFVYENKDVFCKDSEFMAKAGEVDCVPLLKLWVETKGASLKKDNSSVNYYIGLSITFNAINNVRYLVPHCTNINYAAPYPHCGTALYDAVVKDNKEAVKAIIAHPGIDLEAGSNKGVSPLSYALAHQRPEIATILIKAGAKLTEGLCIEVFQGIYKEAVDILVKHLKDPNVIDPKKGITPLHAAIAAGNNYAVGKLLELGAKTDILSCKKYSKEKKTYDAKIDAIKYADIRGDKKIKDLLKAPPKAAVKQAWKYELRSPLKEYKQFFPDAASEKRLVKTLKEWQKTRINQESSDRLPKEIEAGLQNPDPKYVYDNMKIFCDDYFIMLYAAENDCVPLFRLRFEKLKKSAFTFDQKPIPVESFISTAAIYNAGNIIRYLNTYAKNINYTNDSNKCTSLHWAVQQGSKNAVKALLEHPDIDLEAKDGQGVTPLVRAFYSLQTDIIGLLIKGGAELNAGTMVEAVLSYSLKGTDALVKYAKDLNVIDPDTGITPLQAAIAIDYEYAVEKIIKAGARSNIASTKKYSRRGNSYPAKIDAKEYARILGNQKIQKLLEA
jgi:ankyrin repeat protein